MLIHINGIAYDATTALRKPTLNDIMELKVKTRSPDFPEGVSIDKLREYMAKLEKVRTVGDLVSDTETMLGLKALMFLARRRAGEKVTVEEAGDVELDQIRFEIEDSDQALIDEYRRKRSPFKRGRRASAPAGA